MERTIKLLIGHPVVLELALGQINTLKPTLSLTPQVYTHPNATAFDGITDIRQLRAIPKPNRSIRALYLNGVPPFQAAKVRVP